MDYMTALDIGASGLSAQRAQLNVISMNLANARTTRTAEGGPYVRKGVVFESTPVLSPFDKAMANHLDQENLKGVAVRGIVNDERPFRKAFEPGHPDADQDGYVSYPDINVVEEMTNMIAATRSYEANVQTIESVKGMFNKALSIAR